MRAPLPAARSYTVQIVFLGVSLIPSWNKWAIQHMLFFTTLTVLNVVPIIMVIVVVTRESICPDPAKCGLSFDENVVVHFLPAFMTLGYIIVYYPAIGPSLREYAKSLPTNSDRHWWVFKLAYAPLAFLGVYLVLNDAEDVYQVPIPGWVTLLSSFLVDTLFGLIPALLIVDPSAFEPWP